MKTNLIRTCFLAATLMTAAPALADDNVMVVFDGSNSMWGQIEGTSKIEIARGVMQNLLGDWADERQVGLMAYGHRREGDCGDIEVLVEPGQQARQSILDQVNAITPTGRTPLTDAVEQAAETLSYTDQPATIVLISDGLESCERDPCALAETLERTGVDFTAHVVGFGLDGDTDTQSLSCIAEITGGQFIPASNADELGSALSTVGTAVAAPEVEPEPEPEAPEVTVIAPETAVAGSEIAVSWNPTVDANDIITVVPSGSEEGLTGPRMQVNDSNEVMLRVPGEIGLYEVRYLHGGDRVTLGYADIELVEPSVVLEAPEVVLGGAEFAVSWTPTIHRHDRVTIVPAGAEPGTVGASKIVGTRNEDQLRAPAKPGLYEIRYVLGADRSTVASRPIEVVAAQITLQLPETVATGAVFEALWSSVVNQLDYIALVPAGSPDGELGDFFAIGNRTSDDIRAPAEPGSYELRYVLRENGEVLASAPFEVTPAEMTLDVPETAAAGSAVPVAWSSTVNTLDYIAIVPAGSADGELGNSRVVRDLSSTELTAPADPGMYEVRYILREGLTTVATAPIEITEPVVTISAEPQVRTGERLLVRWTGAVGNGDFITLVPKGAADDARGGRALVRRLSEREITVREEPGLYEIRYVLGEGNRVMARQAVEVLP